MSQGASVEAHGTGMLSQLPLSAYVSEAIFATERKRIYESLWIFVGMAHLLDDDNAFVTRTVGSVPVVVQRLRGRLRAFENRCLHRKMPLQVEPFGARPLVCRYHGWAYSEDGCLKGTPNPQLYEYAQRDVAAACLPEFALRRVGNLVFVCVADDPPSFESQFTADFIASLEAASSKFDWEVAYSSFDVPWNWKLNFENVLDWNHVQFVHPKTFFPLMDLDGTREIRMSDNARTVYNDMKASRPVNLDSLSYSVHGPMTTAPNPWAAQIDRFGDLDDYYNWFIFPNVNFCSVHGKMFLIQQFVPKSPGVTEYHLWVVTARRTAASANFTGLLWSLIKGEKSVVDEDAVVLSALQKNMSEGASPYRHGAYEAHIVRMHRWYASHLGLALPR